MKSKKIEDTINEILAIVKKIPEKFQEKCFEVLLTSFLVRGSYSPLPVIEKGKKEDVSEKFIVPIDVRAFLQQYTIPEENLNKLFFMQGNELRPTYKIETIKKAKAQTQITLLTALENALKEGKFEFSVEDIRQRCKNRRVYDSINFKTNVKKDANLFRSLADEEHIELSPDGKAELAETILEVSK